MPTIAIIGAGPAGLMTAATILEQSLGDFHIHIFEKNPTPGNKLLISGGGRCNVTTSITDKKILATKYTRGWDFIKKAMGRFGPKKTYEWFESHGVPLQIQGDLRVFPISDDGHDILGVFEDIFRKYRDRIHLHYGEGVMSVSRFESGYQLITPRGTHDVGILVITTGGNAYRHTGSTGDGYGFAQNLGHTITTLGPSLSSFLTNERWLHDLSGLSFDHARIGDLTGPILLTHFGISGPLAFQLSSELAWELIDREHTRALSLSPIADMDTSDWDMFLREEFEKHPKKLIINILSEKLPRRFAESLIRETLPEITEKYVGTIAAKDREKISRLLGEGMPITLLERRPGDEFVTAGGISTDEIDPETMESKIQKNLYFAGEIMNVDGYTGGYSLQICWSSGYIAGETIARSL